MCFSANASFTASGVLAVIGTASIAKTKTKRGLMYAAVPLLFAVQQLIEGFEWLTPKPSALSMSLAYGFLFFAVILWPVYVPIAVYLIEPEQKKKRIIAPFTILGAVVSLFAAVNFIVNPVSAIATLCCHINYVFNLPLKYEVGAAYVIATCGSMLCSSRYWIRTFGVVALIALGIAYFYAAFAYVSVWCYFAAILSTMVLIQMNSQRHKNPLWWI